MSPTIEPAAGLALAPPTAAIRPKSRGVEPEASRPTGRISAARARFVVNATSYSGSAIGGQAVRFVKGVVVRRLIPPSVFGFWSFASVVQSVLGACDLGWELAAGRDLPLLTARGDETAAARIRSTAFVGMLAQALVVGAVATIILVSQRARFDSRELLAGLVAVAVSIVASVEATHAVFLAGAQAFVPLGRAKIVAALVDGLGTVGATYVWGLSGLMGAAIVTACVSGMLVVVAAHWRGVSGGRGADWATARALVRFGAPMRLADLPVVLTGSLAVAWVAAFLSTESLALFTLANGLALELAHLADTLAFVYAMRFLDQGGRGVPRAVMARELRQFLHVQLLVAVPAVCWAGGVVLPLLVTHFIPRYAAAVPTLLTLSILGFFIAGNTSLEAPWVMDRRIGRMILLNGVGLAVMALLLAVPWLASREPSLESVAWASIGGAAISFAAAVFAVGHGTWSIGERLETVVSVAVAGLWTQWVLRAACARAALGGAWVRDLERTARSGVWALAMLTPVLAYGVYRSGALKGWSR